MQEWMDRYADALGQERVAPQEMGSALKLAREVAHGMERKLAPLSTFLAGVYAGRALTKGEQRADALERAVEVARALMPKASGGAGEDRPSDGDGGGVEGEAGDSGPVA